MPIPPVALAFWAAIISIVLAILFVLVKMWRVRRFKITLSALLGLLTIAAIVLVFVKGTIERHLAAREAVREIQRLGGTIDELGNVFLNRTDADDSTVVMLRAVPNICSLQLAETQITDKTLAELSQFPKLGGLDIRGTHVTRKGVESLKAKLPHCRIAWE